MASDYSTSMITAAVSMSSAAAALSSSLATNPSLALSLPTTTTAASVAAAPTESAITLNASGGDGDVEAVRSNSFVGQTAYNGYTYETTAVYVSGLLGNTSVGVNHYLSVAQGGRPAMDGLVAILTVKIVGRPARYVFRQSRLYHG